MYVCACCRNPEVIPEDRKDLMGMGSKIIVPDETPVFDRQGNLGRGYIDPRVLEKAGLKWDGYWREPSGKLVDGVYDTTAAPSPK